MLAALYLLVTGFAGFAVATRAFPQTPAIVRVPAGFLLAIIFTSWTTYVVADALSGATNSSLKIGIWVSTLLGAAVLARWGRGLRPRDLKLSGGEAVLTLVSLVFSWWLMHAHLRYDDGDLGVSANTWGDMGLHIGLARSFSVGGNYPTEYPFFAGEPIRYHFGFDFFAGMLQEGGASVLWSFNLPGVLGFTSMMLITFALARLLFGTAQRTGRWWRDRGTWIGLVAVSLLVTNQSLGWKRFITVDGHGSLATALDPSTWWHHKDYLTGGPYTGDRMVMFGTLNVYLTQMHLIITIAIALLLAYAVIWMLRDEERLNRKLLIGIGITFGASFWLNGVVWIAEAIFLGGLLTVWGVTAWWKARRAAPAGDPEAPTRSPARVWLTILACFAVPALLLGVPQALWLSGGGTNGGLHVHLGYLVCGSEAAACVGGEQMDLLSLHDWGAFVTYWWLNAGVFIPLLILAFILGNARDRKIIAAITGIFIWGSIFYVGADVGGQNHKVFNLWENLAGPFVAFALIEIWVVGRRFVGKGAGARLGRFGVRTAVVALGVLLTISGFIDFMTIKNDWRVSVFGDQTQQQAMNWIIKDTPPRARFVTDYDQLYNAATMAGRGVALGYSSWASSAGYDADPRKDIINRLYAAADQGAVCAGMRTLGPKFGYIMVGPQERTSPRFKLNEAAFAGMRPAATFGDGDGQYRIYKVADNC